MRKLFATALCLLAAAPAMAGEGKEAQAYNAPPMPGFCSSGPFGEVCHHLFGGRDTLIKLPPVEGRECEDRPLRLVQLSERLAAPVEGKVKTSCGEVRLHMPEVKELTYFRLEAVGASEEEAPATYLLAVYPQNQLDELVEWSQKNHLVIYDRQQKLIPFLGEHEIAYGTVKMPASPGSRVVCIWVPKPSDGAHDQDCRSLLVLHERSETLPYVRVTEAFGRRRVDAYLPLLPTLESHPATQRMFIQLIEATLEGE